MPKQAVAIAVTSVLALGALTACGGSTTAHGSAASGTTAPTPAMTTYSAADDSSVLGVGNGTMADSEGWMVILPNGWNSTGTSSAGATGSVERWESPDASSGVALEMRRHLLHGQPFSSAVTAMSKTFTGPLDINQQVVIPGIEGAHELAGMASVTVNGAPRTMYVDAILMPAQGSVSTYLGEAPTKDALNAAQLHTYLLAVRQP